MRRILFSAERVVPVVAGSLVGVLVASSAQAASELVLIPNFAIAAILIAAFFVLIPFVDALIVQPVFKVIDDRNDKIEGARKRAAKLELDADTVLSKYESAVRDTREESERGRREAIDAARAQQAEITGEARGEAERDIEASRSELEQSLLAARATLRATAQDLAKQAAERVLGRAL